MLSAASVGSAQATSETKHSKLLILSLMMVILGLYVVGTTTTSHLTWSKSGRDAKMALTNVEKNDGEVKVSADKLQAAFLTDVYYLNGNPARCMKIVANPNGNEKGFSIEPSCALASTGFMSGAGYVYGENPTSGSVVTFSGEKWKHSKFYTGKNEINIDGVTYLRRPANANWQCKTIPFDKKSGVLSGYWVFSSFAVVNCQEFWHDAATGAFVVYYPPGITLGAIQSGAGYFDARTNTGLISGFNHGVFDGPYRLSFNAAKNVEIRSIDGKFLGSRYYFKKLSSCPPSNYPQVIQCVNGQCEPARPQQKPQGVTGWKIVFKCHQNLMTQVASMAVLRRDLPTAKKLQIRFAVPGEMSNTAYTVTSRSSPRGVPNVISNFQQLKNLNSLTDGSKKRDWRNWATDNFIGTGTALNRFRFSCVAADNDAINTGSTYTVAYHACNNGPGVHVVAGVCSWFAGKAGPGTKDIALFYRHSL